LIGRNVALADRVERGQLVLGRVGEELGGGLAGVVREVVRGDALGAGDAAVEAHGETAERHVPGVGAGHLDQAVVGEAAVGGRGGGVDQDRPLLDGHDRIVVLVLARGEQGGGGAQHDGGAANGGEAHMVFLRR